ncbi:MAG: hypothetical protein QOK23_4631 [Gammaproteobacteria bacterium]|nr:hypothetical protein [Gammaproteobacteria bacterium]
MSTQEHSFRYMDLSNPSTSRSTLKLKMPTRKSRREPKTALLRPQSKLSQKPGAAWSDELKARMQEDMDALMPR